MAEGIVAPNLAYNIAVFGVVIILFMTMVLSKKLHYFISGLTLISLGVLPLLHQNGIIVFNIDEYPILNFAAYFFVIFAAKDLFKEAIREKESKLRGPTIVFALFLLIITTVPTLHNLKVIDFTINLPLMINYVIYILSGIFLILGMFLLLHQAAEG